MRFVKLPFLVAALLTFAVAGCSGSDDAPPPAPLPCGGACGPFASCVVDACVDDSALDVGTQTSIYSDASGTRGYWFTAPVAFTITGLRVPNEAGAEVQNIEIVKFPATPPTFAATTNTFTQLGRFVNVAGTSFTAVNIPVAAGDIIGIIGARGTTTMRNSYGVANYVTSIKGNAVTLRRLGMQFNLNAAAAHDLWTENFTISRVEMLYR